MFSKPSPKARLCVLRVSDELPQKGFLGEKANLSLWSLSAGQIKELSLLRGLRKRASQGEQTAKPEILCLFPTNSIKGVNVPQTFIPYSAQALGNWSFAKRVSR